eukprot:CAMPEP_0179223380 /NCGR_PEP_ID=MMETSP0797-20121207/7204_1 /TAXON_ID=47934 /ORGANISM="Dinophysis acuminata, Strain DAEP01" /LENGTH=47 /DNA_ID= /DNA_START= /DNA_END= /DNA_ORIENTATION=
MKLLPYELVVAFFVVILGCADDGSGVRAPPPSIASVRASSEASRARL